VTKSSESVGVDLFETWEDRNDNDNFI